MKKQTDFNPYFPKFNQVPVLFEDIEPLDEVVFENNQLYEQVETIIISEEGNFVIFFPGRHAKEGLKLSEEEFNQRGYFKLVSFPESSGSVWSEF